MSEINLDELKKIEDIISSNDFSSMNNIFKQCITSIFELLKNHTEQIKKLENTIDQKCDKTELINSLVIKANNADVMKNFNDITNNLESKVSLDDVNLLINNKIDKINTELAEIKNSIENKANKNFVISALHTKANKSDSINISVINKKIEEIENDLNQLILNIKKQFSAFNDVLIELDNNKIDSQVLNKVTEDINKGINKILDNNNEDLKNDLNDNINKLKNLDDEYKRVNEQEKQRLDSLIKTLDTKIENISDKNIELDTKLSSLSVNNKLEEIVNDLISTINKDKLDNNTNINNLNKSMKSLYNEYNVLKNTVNNELSVKPNLSDLTELLQNKVDYKTLNSTLYELDKLKEKIEENTIKIDNNNNNNINTNNYNNKRSMTEYSNNSTIFTPALNKDIDNLKYEISQIKDSLIMKVDFKELKDYLKGKVDVNDINKALTMINEDLNSKVDNIKFQKTLKNQNDINKLICNDYIMGKWISTNNEIINGNIKWNIQSVNSSPDNFSWDNNNYFISIRNKGIYQIEFILFIDRKENMNFYPNVMIVIDNSIIKGFNNMENEIYDEKIALKFKEYININERSRLSISISRNNSINSFMGILIIKEI
jgi:chromosome segregation ATPase